MTSRDLTWPKAPEKLVTQVKRPSLLRNQSSAERRDTKVVKKDSFLCFEGLSHRGDNPKLDSFVQEKQKKVYFS